MSLRQPGKILRDAVKQGTTAVPGAFNALVGRMIERAGFKATYLSGAAFSASAFALPDIGLFTLTELAQHTNALSRAVDIPIIVDADTGFGEAVNVERTIVELEAAGAAAIQLEDQRLPKRCGHLSGKSLVEPEEMCTKLRAAAASRRDPSTIILARTDAAGVYGIDDAIERAKKYVEAGADWIFPEALATRDDFARFAKEVPVPLVANMTEFGKSPLLSITELDELGYAAALFPVTLMRTAMHAVERALEELKATGTQKNLIDQMQTRQQLYDLLGYEGYEHRDREYFGTGKS